MRYLFAVVGFVAFLTSCGEPVVSPQRPERGFEIGEVIELKLQEHTHSSHIWVATSATSFARVSSTVSFVSDAPDRFPR